MMEMFVFFDESILNNAVVWCAVLRCAILYYNFLLQFTNLLLTFLQWLDFMSAPFQDFMSRKSWDDDPLLSLPPLGHSDQIPEV
jgi:hypothetical protein